MLSRQVSPIRFRFTQAIGAGFSTCRDKKSRKESRLFVVPSGLPESLSLRSALGINFSTCRDKKSRKGSRLLLSRQVSNLNSSDPESDVLPITPRDNFEAANIKKNYLFILVQVSFNCTVRLKMSLSGVDP